MRPAGKCLFFFFIAFAITFSFRAYSSSNDSLLNELKKTSVASSRINLLLQLSKSLLKDKPDSAIILCNQGLKLSKKINSDKEPDCIKCLAEAYIGKPFFEDSALHFSRLLVSVCLKNKFHSRLPAAYTNLAESFGHALQSDSCIYYCQRAIEAGDNNMDNDFVLRAKYVLAHQYRQARRTDNGMPLFRELAAYYSAKNNLSELARSTAGIGICYDMAKSFDSALYYFSMASQYSKKAGDDKVYTSNLINEGMAYWHLKRYKEAETTFKEALAGLRTLKEDGNMIYAYLDICSLYRDWGKTDLGILYGDSSLEIATARNDLTQQMLTHGFLTDLYEQKGDYKNALLHSRLAAHLSDSIYNNDKNKSISEMDAKFKNQEAQNKIESLRKEKELQTAETGRAKNFRNMMALVLVLAGVSAVFGFSRFRQGVKRKQEAERARISRDLHDDVGSVLGSISLYSEVVNKRLEKKDYQQAEEILHKIGHSSREMIEKMSDIVWSVNPNNDSFEQLVLRMKSFASMLLTGRGIEFSFEADEKLNDAELTMVQRKNIFLIFKEAAYNAAKYSECKNIFITLAQSSPALSMTIKDDGKGFNVDEAKASLGNGLKNMKSRADEINAEFILTSALDKGTEINLKFLI